MTRGVLKVMLRGHINTQMCDTEPTVGDILPHLAFY